MKSTSALNKYHLNKTEPKKRQFDFFDLAEYLDKNIEHCSKLHSYWY